MLSEWLQSCGFPDHVHDELAALSVHSFVDLSLFLSDNTRLASLRERLSDSTTLDLLIAVRSVVQQCWQLPPAPALALAAPLSVPPPIPLPPPLYVAPLLPAPLSHPHQLTASLPISAPLSLPQSLNVPLSHTKPLAAPLSSTVLSSQDASPVSPLSVGPPKPARRVYEWTLVHTLSLSDFESLSAANDMAMRLKNFPDCANIHKHAFNKVYHCKESNCCEHFTKIHHDNNANCIRVYQSGAHCGHALCGPDTKTHKRGLDAQTKAFIETQWKAGYKPRRILDLIASHNEQHTQSSPESLQSATLRQVQNICERSQKRLNSERNSETEEEEEEEEEADFSPPNSQIIK